LIKKGNNLPLEIERKFLVKGNAWRQLVNGIHFKQGYISTHKNHTVRIRIAEKKAYLTIKGKTVGAKRLEFEYKIPIDDGKELLNNLCHKPIIDKMRYTIQYKGLIWEVDEFHGENKGLILAEVELQQEDQKVELPEWIGKEVTGNPKYYNANLVINPYSKWGKSKSHI
jgi:adenylate cyclase